MKTKTYFIVAAAVLFVLIFGVVVFFLFPRNIPQNSAEHFLDQITSSEVEVAYQDTASTFKEVSSLEDFQKSLDLYIGDKKVKEISFSSASVEESFAIFQGRFIFSDGSFRKFVLYLSPNSENDWLVNGMEFLSE